jgi:hypothetical protein
VKFLIDECLSPKLVVFAREKGYAESTHVVWRGMASKKDWHIKSFVLDGDWTFATRNSVDFRGPLSNPGSRGQYADVVIHAGLICLNGPEGMRVDMQLELFDQALEELAIDGDLINKVLEITLDNDDEFFVRRYSLPPEELR